MILSPSASPRRRAVNATRGFGSAARQRSDRRRPRRAGGAASILDGRDNRPARSQPCGETFRSARRRSASTSPDATRVVDKIREETEEIAAEIAAGDADRLEDEVGDLLFVVANLARHLEVDPEAADPARQCESLSGASNTSRRPFRSAPFRFRATSKRWRCCGTRPSSPRRRRPLP